MDALDVTLDGNSKTEEDWLPFKLDGASWIEGNQVWVLELEPDDSPPSSRDLEEAHQLPSTEITELKGASVQSGRSLKKRKSGEVKSRIPGHLQTKETFVGNGEAFSQSPQRATHQRSPWKKKLHCDQCGKAYRYPSDLARHQRVHSKQKATKWTQSRSDADSPSSSKPTPVALQVENVSSKVLSQKSKVTTDQGSRCRRWRGRQSFCDQCGKAFRCPSDLARHQRVHSKQRAAKQGQSQSKADSSTPALQVENTSPNSSQVLSQNSKTTTDQRTHHTRRHFCDQCGKAFRCPSDLARHQQVHSKQRAAKQGQSQSEVESLSLLESSFQMENTFTQSSEALHQNSKAIAGYNTRRRKLQFCSQSGKASWCPSDLARHQRVHSSQEATKWPQCSSEADNPNPLELTPLAMLVENTSINASKELRQNSKTTTDQSTHRRRQSFCDQCGKTFRYPSDLFRHQWLHCKQKAAKQGQSQSKADRPSLALQVENMSPNSGQVLSQNSKAATEQSSHRRRRHFCDQCGKSFWYPSELARHHLAHLRQKWIWSQSEAGRLASWEPTPVEPQVESLSTHSSKGLRQNSKVMRDLSTYWSQLPFCDQCGAMFLYPCELTQHQRLHSGQEAAKLSQSQSEIHSPTPSAVQLENMNSHEILHQDSEDMTAQCIHPKKPHICKHCGKCFRSPSDLARHQGTHSRTREPKRCEWLGEEEAPDRSVSTSTPLLPTRTRADCHDPFSHNHKPMTDQSPHTKKTYLCSQCGESFPWPSSLARHERVHLRRKEANSNKSSSGKPSPSVPLPKVPRRQNVLANKKEAICQSSMLRIDRRTCTKKPYLCDQCGEGFWWNSELAQHMYTHFQERPYDCSTCGRRFRRHVQLRKHQKCHEESQEWEEEGERFQNMYWGDGLGEHMPGELLQDLPPEQSVELYEPFASPEMCECGACDSGANNSSELLPANSIWEIGISGQSYLLTLPPACECGCCEVSGEGGGSEQPPGPSLLQAEVASSATLASAVSSCEAITTVPAVSAACPRAQGHVASVPEEETSTASITTDRAARPPRTGSPDPEWLPSSSRSTRLRKRASSSVQAAQPHSCPTCSKRFGCAEYLKKHLEVHRPGKPYCCPLCENRFGRRSYLLKHHRRVHSEPLLFSTL